MGSCFKACWKVLMKSFIYAFSMGIERGIITKEITLASRAAAFFFCNEGTVAAL